MTGRRKKRTAMQQKDRTAREAAQDEIERTKRSLGERGPVWWTDGAPDFTGHVVHNTPYANWFVNQQDHPQESDRRVGTETGRITTDE